MAQPGSAMPPKEAMRTGVSTGAVVAVVIVVALLALAAGVYVGKTYYSSGTAANAKASYLVVGTNIPFPPFEDYNVTTGQYVGFDIDFANLIANATHRTLVIQNYADFSVLLTTVGTGGVDMAASAITESGASGATRNMTMSFSDPYYSANQAVLVKSSSTLTCPANTCDQSELKTLVVGLQSGTTSQAWGDEFLKPNMTSPSTQYNLYTTVDTEVAALEAGSLDAVIIDSGPATAIAAHSGGQLKVAGTIITGELYGFAVAHGDPEGLVAVINGVIADTKSSGAYNQLILKWFG